jgi:ketosteroid isomerase-like protein
MRKITGIAIAASALMLLSGCKMDGKRHHGHADAAAIEKDIRGIETQWVADYNTRDVDKLAGHYSDDAALANPGAALAADSAARRAALTQFVADPTLKIDFASDRVLVAKSGDLISSRGHYTMTSTDPATKQPKTETGSYLTVYKKQPDGAWKAVEDFITPGAPAVAPAQ